MPREKQTIDYHSPACKKQFQPGPWLSHMFTAAGLCVVAIGFDHYMRDWDDTDRVAQIEIALAIYGATCAIVSVVRGVLKKGEKTAVMCCLVVFLISVYVGLMPRLNK